VLRPKPAAVLVVVVCVSAGLLAAPGAWARSVNVNALAHVAYVGTTSGGFQWAGPVTDPALGNGGVQATLRLVPGGYVGTATIVNPAGSLTGAVRATLRQHGQLVHFSLTADITAATGRFAGARGTLTGSALVTATLAIGRRWTHRQPRQCVRCEGLGKLDVGHGPLLRASLAARPNCKIRANVAVARRPQERGRPSD
jgi:hypothetical protein